MVFLSTPWLMTSIAHGLESRKLAWKPHQYFPSVIRSYLWALVILGVATKLSYLEEKHWIAQDHLGTREGSFSTKFEALTFEALKKECETLLGTRP